MFFARPIRFAPGAMLAVLLIVSTGHRSAPPATAAGDCTVDATMDTEEQAFLVLINNYRAQNSLGPLSASYMLTKASAWKSKDLATNNYFAHDDLTRTWIARVRDCGYGFNTWLGENIAAGYTTGASVFAGWQSSPGHNANMLGANYTTIGIGRYFVPGSAYGWYWTTDFGGFSDGWATVSDVSAPIVIGAPLQSADATPITQLVQPPPLAAGAAEAPKPRTARARSRTTNFAEILRLLRSRWRL